MSRIIDQKRDIVHLLFVAELTKEQHGESGCTCLKEPNVEGLVCVGIDRSVQPVALTIDSNRCLINRNLIRINVAVGL